MKETVLLLQLDGSHVVNFFMCLKNSILYYLKMHVPRPHLRVMEFEYLKDNLGICIINEFQSNYYAHRDSGITILKQFVL